MDPNYTDVIKVQEFFHRLSVDKTDEFDAYRKYVFSFCSTYLKNTSLNETLDQLQSLLKERPEIKCALLYKHSKVYRLLVIVSDARILFGIFLTKKTVYTPETSFKDFGPLQFAPSGVFLN